MRLLLDTQILLWTLTDSDRLPRQARTLVASEDAEIFVSVISIWEIAIKFAQRRGRPNDMPISAEETMRRVASAQAEVLTVTAAHALAVETLPLLHRDPFDRMLVAQALAEPLRLVTTDAAVAAYGDFIELV
jgi:PIN domain nuclease of toxin-antitoxin system